MKRCFECFRRLRFIFTAKVSNKKWLTFIQNYCSQNSRDQWCQLIIQSQTALKQYDNPSEQTFRQLKSTNISSQIMRVIRRQHELNISIFSFLSEIFSSYVKNKYIEVINPSQSTISKISKDYEKYTDFMRSLIVIYYELEEREVIGDDQFFKITLSNFVAECLFGKEEFNTCISQVLKSHCRQAQDRISFNMQKFSSLSIKDYEVSPLFSLDSRTLKHFQVQAQIESSKPFSGAIQMVKEIVRGKTPYEKLKNLQSLIRQVQFSITKFYEKYKIYQPINMDADNALSILLYILVQANQNQLLSHILCIQNLTGKQILSGGSMYCLATVKACLQFLEKGNIKRSKGLNIPENEFSLWINVHNYFQQVTNKQL